MGALPSLVAAFFLSILLPTTSVAQKTPGRWRDGEEISIDAEEVTYDQKSDTIVARGQVIINRGDTELRADEVRLNRTTNEADAHGNVSLTDPEGTALAEAVHFNLDEETGSLLQAEVTSRHLQYSLRGDRVEKGLGQSYRIENGRFTTCRCAEGAPSWSVRGDELRVTLEGYGILRGGTFNVLDVPILYVPRALFPVQQERQSGFLTPRFGVSNRRGFQTLLPAYWAIDKSQDATLGFDLETSARVGLVGEYRYALSREAHGLINASYFNEAIRGAGEVKPFETTIPENRWSVVSEHDQPFLAGSHAYSDVFLVSDDLFLRDINTYAFEHAHDVAIRTLPFTASHLGIVRLWDRVALKGEGTYYQDLGGLDSGTLQRAPGIDLWGQGLLGDRVLGEFRTEAVDFQRGHGVDGFRLDVEPGARLPLPLGRFAFGALRASVRETAYHLTEPTLIENGQTRELPRDQSRELLQLGADIGTAVDRVYPFHGFGLEKIKHTIEPMVGYLYVPAVSQEDLPILDGTDRVNHRNQLTYGVVSRLVGKFSDLGQHDAGQTGSSATIRELARLSLAQSYDISREIQPLHTGRADDHFSDVDFDGRVNPSRFLSLRFHTNYDVGDNNISAARVGFFVEDPRGRSDGQDVHRLDTRTSAAVSYRFLTQNLLQEVDSNVVLRLTDWAGFLYASRYDVVGNQFLDNFFGLRLISTCDCWALDFAVTDRTNPQEVEVRAQLTLAGLGSATKSQRRAAVEP